MAELKVGDLVVIYEGMMFDYVPMNIYDRGRCSWIKKENTGIGEIVDVKDRLPDAYLKVKTSQDIEYIYIPLEAGRLYEQPTPTIKKHTIQRKKYSLIGKIIY